MRVSEVFVSCQGEGVLAGVPMVFIRLQGCNLMPHCSYCFVSGTPVLMSDYTQRPIEDIRVGDEVLGAVGPYRRLEPTPVLETFARRSDVVAVNGRVACTPDHPFLVDGHWAPLSQGVRVKFLGHPPLNRSEYKRGWLAGYIAGDGNFHEFTGTSQFVRTGKTYLRFKVASKDEELIDNTITWAGEFGFGLRKILHDSGRGHLLHAAESTRSSENERFHNFLYGQEDTPDYARGFLAGAFDAEGNPDWTRGRNLRIRFSQKTGSALSDDIVSYARILGFDPRRVVDRAKGMDTILIYDAVRFYIECPPVLGRKVGFGRTPEASRQLVRVEELSPLGVCDVVNLRTGSGSFVAAGFVVHNCDTAYAQDPSGGEEMTPVQVANTVLKMQPYQRRWICITGGEPLLYAEELYHLIKALKRLNSYLIEVETNGSFEPPKWYSLVDSWVPDIKCPSSGVCGVSRVGAWFRMRRKDQVKFVVSNAEDLGFVRETLKSRLCAPTVLVSPAAMTLADKRQDTLTEFWNREWLREVWEFCVGNNLRYSLQVHKLVYGNRKGV